MIGHDDEVAGFARPYRNALVVIMRETGNIVATVGRPYLTIGQRGCDCAAHDYQAAVCTAHYQKNESDPERNVLSSRSPLETVIVTSKKSGESMVAFDVGVESW